MSEEGDKNMFSEELMRRAEAEDRLNKWIDAIHKAQPEDLMWILMSGRKSSREALCFSKTPWKVAIGDNGNQLLDADNVILDQPLNGHDRLRTAICVNFCAGIPSDELISYGDKEPWKKFLAAHAKAALRSFFQDAIDTHCGGEEMIQFSYEDRKLNETLKQLGDILNKRNK